MCKRIPTRDRVLMYINQYTADHGFAPSLREIASGVGLSSPGSVHHHIALLKEEGLLKDYAPRKSRALSMSMSIAFFKSFDLKAMTSQHKQTANSLLEIRDELKLLLLQIHLQTEDEQALYNQYEALVRRLDTVYKDAPSTTEKAVGMARTALQINKDNDITDKEIDLSLPIALRKGAGKE